MSLLMDEGEGHFLRVQKMVLPGKEVTVAQCGPPAE